MTIENRAMNEAYSNFLNCTENAPEYAFKTAKEIASWIEDHADYLMSSGRDMGIMISGSDEIRNYEVYLYGMLKQHKNLMSTLTAAEGFGAQLDHRLDPPPIDQVLENLADALRDLKARGLPDRYNSDVETAEKVEAALAEYSHYRTGNPAERVMLQMSGDVDFTKGREELN